jgi:glucan phosphoethanolaminetransferase (alkaline phosphatase superfamily)
MHIGHVDRGAEVRAGTKPSLRAALLVLAISGGPVVLLLCGYDFAHSQVIRPATSTAWADSSAVAFTALSAIALALAVVTVAESIASTLFRRLVGLLPGMRGEMLGTLIVIAAGSPVLYLLARQPFIGNRYKDTPVAVYGPWVVLLLLAALTAIVIWAGHRLILWLFSASSSGRVVLWVSGLVGATAAFVVLVDTVWYPGWYPVVHSALSFFSVMLLQIAVGAVVVRNATLRRAARLTTRVLVVAVVIAAATVTAGVFRPNRVTLWRLSTGTLFASRVVSPLLHLVPRHISFSDLDELPAIDPRFLLHFPAVTGQPEPVASTALLVTVDALRADTLGLYGSKAGLTPHIDSYFQSGDIFERAYSQYAATRHSVRGIVDSHFHQSPQGETAENLINRVRDYGFDVIGVLPTDMRLFVNVEHYNFSRVRFYDDAGSVPQIVKSLTENLPTSRTLIWVHLYQPHDPYEPPSELATGTSARARYDGEVRWVDRQFYEIVSELPSPPDLMILGADHGEEFWEHGGTLHGRTVYDETIRVPLLLRIAGQKGRRHVQPVANVDIAPTILATLGVSIPDRYEGYDLLGRSSSAPPDRVIYSGSVTNDVAAIVDRWKWIHQSDTDGWEAYDLVADPAELRNLASAHPEIMEKGRAVLWAYEFAERTLPSLKAAGLSQYVDWLQKYVDGKTAPSDLGRWAGFRMGGHFGENEQVQRLLQQAFTRETEPTLRLLLMDNLSTRIPRSGSIHRSTDPASSMELLRDPHVDPTDLAFLLNHHLAVLRTLAAERLAATDNFLTSAESLAVQHPDRPTRRGFVRGLAARPDRVRPGFFRQILTDEDVEIRMAALTGICAQEGREAVPLLRRRFGVERSPSARGLILNRLLALDPNSGLAALRTEIEHPILSDYLRAKLIAENKVIRESGHLLELFTRTESLSFRNDLFRFVTGLGLPRTDVDRIVSAMRDRTSEPALRARLGRYLSRASVTPDHEDDKTRAPRER